jgi:hypothetical protein
MDVTAAPSWDSGLVPNKENLAAASWAKFAQMNVSSAVAASTEAKTISGTEPGEVYWRGLLAMHPPVRRLAAWERVPTAAKSQRFPATIMKRVALSSPGEQSPYNMRASTEARSTADAPSSWRMKLLHRPWDGLKQHEGFRGGPLTEASMTSLRMQSRVAVANALLAQAGAAKPPTSDSEYRIVPVKRSLGHISVGITERMMPGNRLPTYIEIRPLLEKAEADGVTEIDLTKASYAHSAEILHNLHHNPRQHLAAHGLPDLSCITDHTEPSSPPVMSPPRSTSGAKSPTKRDPIPSSPLQSCKRLKATKVDLLPASSPKAEPSPTKSASPPATPLKEVLVTPKLAITPSAFNASHSSRSVIEEDTPRHEDASFMSAHRASSIFSFSQRIESSPIKPATASPNKRPWSAVSTPQTAIQQPAMTFQFPPHGLDWPTFDSPAQHTESGPSPTKMDRPVAPTPSKWNRCEFPSTPLPASPNAFSRIDTPKLKFDTSVLETGSPPFQYGGLDSPAFPADLSGLQAGSHFQLPEFSFASSPIPFDTPDAGTMDISNTPNESKRLKNLFDGRRRQSEPLHRNTSKVQKRRRTASPEKLAQKVAAATESESLTFTPTKSAVDAAQEGPVKNVQTPRTPGTSALAIETAAPDANDVETGTPSIHVTPAAEQTSTAVQTETTQANSTPGVLNIDVRENPDIFGIHRQDHAVNRLAQMADTDCDGHAKVNVSQENGRLIVRFKLPAEYASIFPDSQGCDDSHFTTSPSVVSSSPRIQFGNAQSTPDAPGEIPPLSYTNPTRPIRSSPLKQSPVTRSPAEPQSVGRSALWGSNSSEADPDATYIVPSFESPVKMSTRGPLDVLQAETPLRSQGISELQSPGLSILDTPTMTGVGVANRDTPDHLRFSMIGTPSQDGALSQTPMTASQTPLNFQSPGLSILETPTMSGIGVVNRDTPDHLRFSPEPFIPGTSSFQIEYTPTASSSADQTARTAKSPTSTSKPKVPMATMEIASPKATTLDIAESDAIHQVPEDAPSVGSPRTPPPADIMESTTPTSSPPLNLAFTPVNQHTPRRESPKASPEAASIIIEANTRTTAPAEEEPEREVPSVPIVAASPARVVDDDSPGREYMREFIKRSKPRRLSTLESGSPVAQPAERMPLGAKSPNTASPQKGKRKADDSRENESPIKKSIESAPKRTRRTVRAPKNKGAKDIDELAANGPEDDADNQEDDADVDSAPTTRRSSRLRVLGNGTSANSRSTIPTPIKLRQGSRGSAVGPANATIRNEQQDLMHQTRLNTRRNKGNAEYPAQVLARRSQELQEDEQVQETTGEQSKVVKDRKNVVWKEPLEAYQEQAKKGKAAAKPADKPAPKTSGKILTKTAENTAPNSTEKTWSKSTEKAAPKTTEKATSKTIEKTAPKTTQQSSGIAKPRKTAAAKKADAVEARPQRVTRSRARTQA